MPIGEDTVPVRTPGTLPSNGDVPVLAQASDGTIGAKDLFATPHLRWAVRGLCAGGPIRVRDRASIEERSRAAKPQERPTH